MFTERRRFPRVPVNQRAFVVLDGHQAPSRCSVRELSPVGTLLHVPEDVVVPQTFDLLLGTTEIVRCRLVHRTGNAIGAEFVKFRRAA